MLKKMMGTIKTRWVANDAILGVGLVVVATFLLAFRSILVKLAYSENVAVLDLLYYRFLIAVPILVLFAIYKKRRAVMSVLFEPGVLISCLLAGLFGYYLATLSDFHSLKLIDANVNRMIVYTYPIYVLVLNAIVERKWPSFRDIGVFGLVQIGLFFVLGGVGYSFHNLNKMGVLLALAAAVSYSIYIILNQQTGKKIGSILFTTYALVFSFIFITIHFFAGSSLESMSVLSPKSAMIIIIMALFCTVLPLLFISEGIARIGASRFSMINTSGPVMTLTLAYFILKETLSAQQIMGTIFILWILYQSEKSKLN